MQSTARIALEKHAFQWLLYQVHNWQSLSLPHSHSHSYYYAVRTKVGLKLIVCFQRHKADTSLCAILGGILVSANKYPTVKAQVAALQVHMDQIYLTPVSRSKKPLTV